MTTTVAIERGRSGWLHDFALGVRLAVGGGRTSWVRLALGTVGIGLAVAVLLVFASVGHFVSDANGRTAAREPSSTVVAGVSATQVVRGDMAFRGVGILGNYVHGTGPNSPVPPGLSALPGPNEVVLSPALADLLAKEPGLRPRFPQKIVGTIGEAGLRGPAELAFYAGTGPLPATGPGLVDPQNVYGFGRDNGTYPADPTIMLVAAVGGVALLVPILIFVAVSSRIAGAQRDRRLAALRLVGAGNRQVRRIAAAESLVSAGAGLVLGALAFLGIRLFAPQVEVMGWSAFTDDIVPSLPLTVLIVLMVPALAVGTVLFALRRVIIEPLGVVRQGRPIRRRLWWRLGLIVVGIGLLIAVPGNVNAISGWLPLIVIGSMSLLIGVPAILPWLLERVVGPMRGGTPSWQLAVRRLQLDSGTPARVVSGLAVVLASAITLQLTLVATAGQFDSPSQAQNDWVTVNTTVAAASEVAAELAKVPAAKQVGIATQVSAVGGKTSHTITIAPCASIEHALAVHGCADGDGFLHQYPNFVDAKPGDVWNLVAAHDTAKSVGTYTVPANLIPASQQDSLALGPTVGDIVLTPAAAAQLDLPADRIAEAWVLTDPHQADASDQIATALGNLTWRVFVSYSGSDYVSSDQKSFEALRGALLASSLFTLLLAGISMLVLAVEQVRERRRPLAMLAAAGVPRSVLARSLLWQTAVPVLLAVLVAVGTGLGLSALVIRLTGSSLRVDWLTIGVFTAAALVLVFLVTALSLPELRSATRQTALRME